MPIFSIILGISLAAVSPSVLETRIPRPVIERVKMELAPLVIPSLPKELGFSNRPTNRVLIRLVERRVVSSIPRVNVITFKPFSFFLLRHKAGVDTLATALFQLVFPLRTRHIKEMSVLCSTAADGTRGNLIYQGAFVNQLRIPTGDAYFCRVMLDTEIGAVSEPFMLPY